jgi:hypothetical protein
MRTARSPPLGHAKSATAIAAASAAAAVGTFLAYLYFARRSEAHAAREEALALAETRGEVIVDLRQRLVALERRRRKTRVDCENRVRDLETALEATEAEARDHAYRMQRFYLPRSPTSFERSRLTSSTSRRRWRPHSREFASCSTASDRPRDAGHGPELPLDQLDPN